MSAPLKARAGHTLTTFSIGPRLTEVIEFGGTPQQHVGSDEKQLKMADTTLLQFSECICNRIVFTYTLYQSVSINEVGAGCLT